MIFKGKPINVLYFGDSIIAGSNIPDDDQTARWTSIVQKLSEGKYKEINEGKPGRPTDSFDEFISAFDKHFQSERIDMLVLALGTNDSRDTSSTGVVNAVNNIDKMIVYAKGKTGDKLRILVCGPYNMNKEALVNTKAIGNKRDENLKQMNIVFEKLAKKHHCEFISFYGILPLESLLKDGVHPDKKGNHEIAQYFIKSVQE